jgi:uroporphyrinogen III methyltransferase / synthase
MSRATRPPSPARPPPPPPPPPRPLAGRRIAVTRAREQAGALVRELEALGAEVVAAPTIRVAPLADLAALRAALTSVPPYDWIVFTSQNAVQVVCDRLPEWALAPRDVARAAVAAIGPATAEALVRRGVVPDLVPERFVAEAVVAALAAQGDMRGKRLLLPRARAARDALPEGLRALGAVVDVLPVYETVREAGDGSGLAAAILAGKIDAVTFTSSSTVRGFVELVGRTAAGSGRFAAAVIGPVTAGTARELGITVAIEAAEYTAAGLLDALVRHFERGTGSETQQA